MKCKVSAVLVIFCSIALDLPAQGTCLCSKEKLTSSIPRQVLEDLNEAASRGDLKKILTLASQPQSGLKVISRSKDGRHSTSYVIMTREGCTVVEMSKIIN